MTTRRPASMVGTLAASAIFAISGNPLGAAAPKPPQDRCAAAADVTANYGGYIVADLEGRLSPAERGKATPQKIAEFEQQLTVLRPKVDQARAVARLFVEVPYPDSLFDEFRDMQEADRDAFIARCSAAYVR